MNINDQLYVNNKWYMDVTEIDSDNVKVRIKYYENPNNKSYYLYKNIKLPISIFSNFNEDSFIIKCIINEKEFKEIIGGLIDRIVKENDITKILEDAGMGAVVSPGLSGTPGLPGTSGSGDISGVSTTASVLPSNEYGLEIDTTLNKKIRKKMFKSKNAKRINIIKQPVLILKEQSEDIHNNNTDNDYKTILYQFLDYPVDNDYDIKFIKIISKFRPLILNISTEILKSYFKNLYTTNKSLIIDNCSDWFINNMYILANIQA